MVDQLKIERDPGSLPTFFINISDEVWKTRLSANVDFTLTVPAGAAKALISADDFVFVAKAAITLPTLGAAFAKGAGELAKETVTVTAGEILHFRARNATDISVSFYS